MQAIAWHGTSGAEQCDSPPHIVDGTDALVWALRRENCDVEGVVVEVGEEVCSFDVGDFVIVLDSAGDHCCSSSLWGLTEFVQAQPFGRLLRVPLAEFNLLQVRGAGVS